LKENKSVVVSSGTSTRVRRVIHRFLKIMLWFSLGAGCLFLLLAGLLAATLHSLDLTIHDRYFVILPSRLLLLSAFLFIATLIVWKARVSH
jgi:hypothetical protein